MKFSHAPSFLTFLVATAVILASPADAGQVRGSMTIDPLSASGRLPTRRRLDKKSGPKKRDCKITRKSGEVEVECKTKTEDKENDVEIKDEIEYKVKASEKGASIKVEYKNEIEMEDVETETETQYDIFFDKIVEFTGMTNPDGSYSYETDASNHLREWPLRDWQPFSEIVTSDDGVKSSFWLTSIVNETVIVEFNFTVSRAEQGEVASANTIKIDFRLTGWDWVQQEGSNVALLTQVESKKKVKTEHEGEDSDEEDMKKKPKEITISFDEAIEGTGVRAIGKYTWAETAEAMSMSNETGTDVAVSNAGDANETEVTSIVKVVATSPEMQMDDKVEFIAFTFLGDGASGAEELYWDPEAGIEYASESGASAVGASSAVGLTFSAVIGALWMLVSM